MFALKHDWNSANLNSIFCDYLPLSSVSNIHVQWSGIRAISKAALKWCDCFKLLHSEISNLAGLLVVSGALDYTTSTSSGRYFW